MSVTSALLSFAVVAALLTVTPGLDTALVLRATLREGRRVAAATALGVNAGVLAWGLLAAVGVSALLLASQTAFTVVRLVGAAYLVWLGVGLWRTALRGGSHALADGAGTRGGALAGFRRGLVTNLLNPKVGAFYVAVIPQFLPDGVPHALMGVLLALVHNALGLVWFALVVLAAGRVRGYLSGRRGARAVDGVTGTALVGLGVRLALTR